MTITIVLPEETAARLISEERAQGRPAADIAAEVIVDRFQDAESLVLDDFSLQSIRQGLADAAAGQTYSIEEASARADTALAVLHVRHGSRKPPTHSEALQILHNV